MQKNTKLFVLMIILISLISISAVSAEEIDTDNDIDGIRTQNTVTVTNATYSQYFDSDGQIINGINSGDIVDLSGNFDLVKFNISQPLTITSSNRDAVLTNSTIYLEHGADGTTISYLNITNINTATSAKEYSIGINVFNASNVNIINNYLDCENPNATPMRLDCANNALIENNTVKNGIITSWGKNAAIVLFTSDDVIINNNTILDGYCNGIYFSWWGGSLGGGFSYRATITNNTILSYYKQATGNNPDSYNYAIQYMGCDGYIANNTINGTFRGVSGVGYWQLSNPYNNTMINNTLSNICGDYAIYGNLNSTIANNTITDSTSNGIWIENGNVNVYNNIISVTKNGITISSFNATIAPDSNYNVENNNISAGGYGVYIDCNKLYTTDIKILNNNISSTKESVFNKKQTTTLSVNVEHILISGNNMTSSATFGVNLQNKVDDVNVTNNYIISSSYQGNSAVKIVAVNNNYVISGNTPTRSNISPLKSLLNNNILRNVEDPNIVEVTNDNVDTFISTLTSGNIVKFSENINGKQFNFNDLTVTITSDDSITLTNCQFNTDGCIFENLTLKYDSEYNKNQIFIIGTTGITINNCDLNVNNANRDILVFEIDPDSGCEAFEFNNNNFKFISEHSINLIPTDYEAGYYGSYIPQFKAIGNNITANCEDFIGFAISGYEIDESIIEFANNIMNIHGENVKLFGIVEMEGSDLTAIIHDNSLYMECSYGDLAGYNSALDIYIITPLGIYAETVKNGLKIYNNNLTLYVNNHDPRVENGNRANSYTIMFLNSEHIEMYNNNILSDASKTGFTGPNDFVFTYIMTTNGCNGLKVHDNNFTGKGTYYVTGVQSLGDKNGEYYNNVFDIDAISTSYQFYSDGVSSGLNIHNNNFTGKSEVAYGISLTDQTTNFQFKDNNIYLEGNYPMGYATYGSKGNTITGNNITCIGIGSEDPDYSWDLLGAETVGIRLMGTTTGYTITDNRIITNQDYAIDLKSHNSYAKSKSNTITDNILIAKELDGDEAVNEAEDNTVHDNLGKITPVLTVKDFTTETNKKVTVSVTVLDEDGENVDGGNVTVNLGGKDYIGTVNNGIAKVSVKAPAGAGTYTLTATYAPENLVYNTAETTATVKVKEPVIELIDTVTSITPSTGEVNSTIDVAINVVDVNGGNVNSGSVKVEFNGKTETITLTNGVATYNTVLPDTSGEYNLIATFVGDNTYKTSSTNEIITVTEKNNTNSSGDNETNVTLVDTSLSMKFDGINQILTGNLADVNNNPIKANVDISLTTLSTGDVKTYTVSSDDTGKFSLNLNLAAGDYSAKSTYAGDNKYASSSSDKVLISISNTPSNVILADEDEVTGVYGEDNEFNGVLTDKDGNALSGYHIALNLTRLSSGASKIYWVTTDYNGNYVLPINLAPGVYTVRTSIDDKNFTGSSLSSLIIEDPNSNTSDDNRTVTVLNTPNLNLVNGVGGVFEGLLLDNLGYGVAGQHVDLKLSNVHGQYKVYSVTTDYEGKFSLPINLGLGTYTVESIYNGTGDYQGTSNIKTIKVE